MPIPHPLIRVSLSPYYPYPPTPYSSSSLILFHFLLAYPITFSLSILSLIVFSLPSLPSTPSSSNPLPLNPLGSLIFPLLLPPPIPFSSYEPNPAKPARTRRINHLEYLINLFSYKVLFQIQYLLIYHSFIFFFLTFLLPSFHNFIYFHQFPFKFSLFQHTSSITS